MHWRHKGSHLHNNDARLVSRSAHVLCWQCALALSLSVRGPGRASPAVWHAGVAPLAACLAMTHVAVLRLTPNARGRPFCDAHMHMVYSPPGQLPTWTTPHQDNSSTRKTPHHGTTPTTATRMVPHRTIPSRTISHQDHSSHKDNSSPGQLPTRTTLH